MPSRQVPGDLIISHRIIQLTQCKTFLCTTFSRCHSTPGCLYLPFLTQHEKKRYCFHSVYLYHGGTVPVQKRSHFKERQDTEDLSKLCGSTSLVVAVVPYTSPFPSAPPMVSILDLTAWFPEVRFTAIPVTCLRRIA